MEKPPRQWLRIALVEVQEEGNIGEFLQVRRVICHGVPFSWEELRHVAVVVEEALVVARQSAQQGGGCAVNRHGSFPYVGHCRGVVGEVFYRRVRKICKAAHGINLCEQCRVR